MQNSAQKFISNQRLLDNHTTTQYSIFSPVNKNKTKRNSDNFHRKTNGDGGSDKNGDKISQITLEL